MAIRKINIKSKKYYFYNDLINIKNLNNNKLKLDKKDVLGNDVYYIGYITKKKHVHFEEIDGDKYLIICSENGDIIQKYQEAFDGIKEIIKKINDYGQPIKYDDNYIKIKFNTGDYLFPYNNYNNKICDEKDDKYYPQLFLDDCLYEV